jgi:hypothetical protein
MSVSAFGYSLVGHVVECGANVEDADSLMGSLSLPFSMLTSDHRPLVFIGSMVLILSTRFSCHPSRLHFQWIVHDAHPRMGGDVWSRGD